MEWLVAACAIGGVWFSWQYGWWRTTIAPDRVRILMYHMVAFHKPKARYNKLRVEPDQFEKQIRWLSKRGWQFVFVSELERIQPKERVKAVALTFDDGYRDNYLIAHEVLKKYGAKATLFLTVERHDQDWSSKKKRHHDDQELMNEPKLLDEDVKEMLSSGHWELGGHSMTHANFNTLSDHEIKREIDESKRSLQDTFSCKVSSFAYPFGIYTERDVAQVKRSGYRLAVTTNQGIPQPAFASNNAYELPRVKVSGHDGLYAFRLRMRTGKCRLKD